MHLGVRIAVVGGLSVVAIATAAALSLPSQATQDAPGSAPAAVRVATVEAAPTSRAVMLHGMTRAKDRSNAAFTSGGRVVQRLVDIGSTVESGDVLARLDPIPLAHQVAQAEAQLADLQARLQQVRADRARLEALDAGKAVAPAELERLVSQQLSLDASVAQAQVGLDEARRQQREGVLRAPYAAEVIAVHVEAGETIAAGRPVVSLAGRGLEAVVEAPESVWAGLQAGTEAMVELPGIGCNELPARVERVASGTSGPSALFPVHIALPDGQDCSLAPGLMAEVHLSLPVAPGLAVPVRAVVDPTGNQASVLRVRDDVVERVAITPMRLHGDEVAVTGGIERGDEIVVAGLVGLVDGQSVRVLR